MRQRASLPPAVGSLVSDLGLRRSQQLSRCCLDLFLPPRCRGRRGSLCRDHPPVAVACRVVSAAAALAALFRLGVSCRSDHPVGRAQVSGDPGRALVRLTQQRLQPRSSRCPGALCGCVDALQRRNGRGAPGHAQHSSWRAGAGRLRSRQRCAGGNSLVEADTSGSSAHRRDLRHHPRSGHSAEKPA